MMLKCIDRNIIVEKISENEYIDNGIIVKSNELNNFIGNVLCIGNNVKEISVGDKVIFAKEKSQKIVVEGLEYFVLNEADVLAII